MQSLIGTLKTTSCFCSTFSTYLRCLTYIFTHSQSSRSSIAPSSMGCQVTHLGQPPLWKLRRVQPDKKGPDPSAKSVSWRAYIESCLNTGSQWILKVLRVPFIEKYIWFTHCYRVGDLSAPPGLCLLAPRGFKAAQALRVSNHLRIRINP